MMIENPCRGGEKFKLTVCRQCKKAQQQLRITIAGILGQRQQQHTRHGSREEMNKISEFYVNFHSPWHTTRGECESEEVDNDIILTKSVF
jgi:hypothetical protein